MRRKVNFLNGTHTCRCLIGAAIISCCKINVEQARILFGEQQLFYLQLAVMTMENSNITELMSVLSNHVFVS